MSRLLQNLRYACRVLRRQPTFSSVAILTLALGIGAAAAVFTVAYGVRWTRSLLPLANIKSLASLVDASIAGRRFTMVVFLAFAVIAAMLSAIGVYSVLAYLVSQRTNEIGLRLAIGASPSGIVWLFVREGMVLTAVGLTAGLAGAVAADQWIRRSFLA